MGKENLPRIAMTVLIVLAMISIQLSNLAMVSSMEGSYIDPTWDDTCYVQEDPQEVRIGNDLVELSFRKDVKGGLDRILDKATGIDLRSDKEVPPIVYAIFYDPGTGTDAALQWDATTVIYKHSTYSSGSELYINHTKIKGLDLNTSIQVRIDEGSSLFRMRLDIECGSNIIIKYAFFPLVWGMGSIGPEQDDDYIFYPTGDGLVLRDPIRDIDSLYLSDMYPAGVSMQFMCHYDPDEAGLYLATEDTQGYPKKLNMVSLDWDSQRRLSSYFQLFPPEYPGNGLEMTYDALLGTFHGDWYDASDIYSEWAMTTPFVSGGKVGIDKDTPDWWLNTSVLGVANRDRDIVHNTLPAIVEMTQEMSDLTDLNTTALIFAWEKEGGWVGPNFFPPAEGEAEFISAMDDLNSTNDHGFVYMSGTVWRITRGDIGYSNWSYFNSTGKPWAALKEDGSVLMDENYATIDWQCARMCPHTQFWHDLVVQNFLECIRLGVDVIQIDEFPIGTNYPCYNASHGHPVGYSRDMSIALRSILEECRDLGRDLNPDLVVSVEEPCEFYLPCMDTYVSRDNAEEYMLYPWSKQRYVDRVQFVPAFRYVYSEFITSFGEPLYLGKSYPEVLNSQIQRGLARSLVQGEVASGGGAKQSDIWPDLLELYNRSARAASTYANEYLVKGRMLRPPVLEVPKEQVDWYFGSIDAFGNPFNESAILNSAWRSPGGNIGHVLVNWIDDPVTFDLELSDYDLGPENVSLIKTTNGVREKVRGSVSLPLTLTMTMEPNDVVLIELLRAPDISLDITDPGPILTNETVDLELTISNGGSVPTEPFVIDVSLEGTGKLGSIEVSSIQAGSTTSTSFLLDTTGIIGDLTLTVEADPSGLIQDLLEDNNAATLQLQVLERPRSDINVMVLDNSTDDPIEGCNITLTRTDGMENLLRGRTGPSGQASFPSLVAGSYSLHLNRTGYFNETLDLGLPEGIQRDITVRMDSIPVPVLHRLTGNVTDNSTGEPLDNVNITLSPSITGSFSPILAWTNVSGHFQIDGIPPGNYILITFREGYFNRTNQISIPATGSIDIALDPIPTLITTGILKGSVMDPDGDPIPDANLTIIQLGLSVMTGEDGTYEFNLIQLGSYTLNITAEGFMPSEVQVMIEARIVCYRNITLDPIQDVIVLGSIVGRVVDPEGEPIAGARINDGDNVTVATTIANGSFSITDLIPGTYEFTVWADGYHSNSTGRIAIDGNTVTLTITLEPIEVPYPADPGEDHDISPVMIAIVLIVILVAIVSIVAYLLTRRGSNPEQWGE
jgi:hypothetical protein